MEDWEDPQVLLARLKAFAFPDGEKNARRITRVRLTERGEMRQSPEANWVAFSAEESIEARQSGFMWQAHFRTARVLPLTVTDAYREGHGRLVVKVGGALPVVNASGPEVDRGELQRCLANILLCPPMLINHPTLEWNQAGAAVLEVRDTTGIAGASIRIEIAQDGCPFCFHAVRPRTAGKKTISTPWTGTAEQYFEREGMRVPERITASWQLREGLWTYYRAEIQSYVVESE